MDWLSSFLDLAPVRGRLDLRCHYGAPWRIDQARAGVGEIAYHVVLAGSVTVAGVNGRPAQHLAAGDILLLLDGNAHTLHDGSGATAVPAQSRPGLNLTITENAGTGERLDMLCGHFIVTSPHLRLLRAYLPPRLVIRTGPGSPQAVGSAARGQLSDLVELMRRETDTDGLGGRAMLNAFSAALFALALRFVAEAGQAPSGLLALAGSPRLAPAVTAMFLKPGHPWTLPELAGLCSMSLLAIERGPLAWTFTRRDESVRIIPAGRVRVSAAEGVRAAVLAGIGYTVGSEWGFGRELADGRVQEVLADWPLPPVDLWAVFPPGRQPSARARAFVTFITARLKTP